MRVAPARSSGPSCVMSDSRVSTATAAPSAAGPGSVGGGDRQQVRVPVVQRPSAAARAGAARATGPSPRCRRRGRGSPGGRSAGRRAPEVLDEVAGPGRGVGTPRAGRASSELTRIASTVIAPPPPGRRPRRTWSSTSRRATRAARARPGATAGAGRRPEPGPERGAERGRVVGRDEQPRPGAVGAVTEGLRHPADLGRDDRQAAGERLGDDHAVRLRARREHQQVRRAVAAGEIGSGLRPREAHAAVQPAVEDPATQTLGERRVALQAADAQAVPATGRPASRARRAARRGPCRGSPRRRESSAPAVAVPGARSAASTPGSATWTRSPGSE